MLRSPERLERLKKRIIELGFLISEFYLGIVSDVDECGDKYAAKNLIRYQEHSDRLRRITADYVCGADI